MNEQQFQHEVMDELRQREASGRRMGAIEKELSGLQQRLMAAGAREWLEQAELVAGVALEGEHRVDHMLQHPLLFHRLDDDQGAKRADEGAQIVNAG